MKLKLKYFIRGLGIGIFFTAIAMSLSLQASRSRIIRENALTKEEIMEKAMGYGMILDSPEDTSAVEKDSKEEDSKEEQSQDDTKEVDDSQNDNSQEDADDSQEEIDSDSISSDKSEDESSADSAKENDLSKNEDSDDSIVSIDYIGIKITSGMTATSVANILKEKNIIEDSEEFRIYMSEQGYSSKIRTGEYLIPVGATYKKIADIITKK